MLIDRRWRLLLSLLVAAGYAVPTLAQQPAPDAAAPPGATVKKPKPKPKPAPAATTGAADPITAAAGGVKPTLLGQYGDWGAYTASPGGKKICFTIAKPASSETTPAGKARNPSYMFISSRPGEKVTDEVSIIIGYPFKPNSEATVAVGNASFALYTQQDGAWIKNAAEEAHLIDAMRSGDNAVIKGTSARGTRSTDVFSLKGLAQALDRSDQDCK
jgi:Invasion associated locus B (IalB) protein